MKSTTSLARMNTAHEKYVLPETGIQSAIWDELRSPPGPLLRSHTVFSMKRRFSSLAVGVLALVGANSSASAQVTNTGIGAGPTDPSWMVSWGFYGSGPCPGGIGSGCSAYTAPTGGPVAATIVTSPPTPPWTPNNPGFSQWIGIAADATQAHTSGWAGGDNAQRFLYTFSTVLGGTSSIIGDLGWDNRLLGYEFFDIGGASLGGLVVPNVSWLTPTPTAAQSGFCRDSDGLFPTSGHPGNCLASMNISYVANAKSIKFYVVGDGATDGLRIDNSVAGFEVVPEPSTYALMASGLVALAIVARRRRHR